MFYRIGTSVIHGECRLVKTFGKLCLFYSPSKGGLRNLAQSLLHDLSSYPPPRRAFSSPLVRVFLFIRIVFTWWSVWAFPITGISFIIGRNIRAWRGLLSLCNEVSFLDLQFLAANPFISMFVYQVTPSSIATSTSMDRLRTALLLVIYMISLFKVVELALLMNVNWFCMGWTDLLWSWTRHNC